MSMEKLQEIKEKVEVELEKYFDEKIAGAQDATSREAMEFLKDYTMRGGKRIRVGMLVYGYGCFKQINDEIIRAAMVMELIQSYLLIHDDIMDKDNIRRGKDSMHVMYERKYNVNDKKHFGMSMAICVGDLASALANEVILDSNFENKDEVVNVMSRILEKVCEGQMLDIVYGSKNADEVSEEDVMLINRMKTATYTVEGPLHLGALLAGVNDERLDFLLNYGVVLGKAFQVRNDINDIFLSDKIGKDIGSDLKEGKRTLLIVKTLENCSDEEKKFVLDKLGTDLDMEDLEKFRDIIKRNALSYCEDYCKKSAEESRNIIKDLDLNSEGKEFLLNITDFVATKSY